jgi:ribosomal biogenesis protein LAS1
LTILFCDKDQYLAALNMVYSHRHQTPSGFAPRHGATLNPNLNRRKLGTRIKQGLESIQNLDAVQNERSTEARQSTKRPREDKAPSSAVASSTREELGLKPPATVFAEDWSDWTTVKQQLFPSPGSAQPKDAGDSVQAALKTMQVWLQRSRNGAGRATVPAYVESTMLLVKSQQLDRQASEVVDVCTADVLRASYAHSLSRAVHLMTGSLVKSRSFMNESTTYRQRAQSSGFPEEAVEVRQRIAHGAEPVLSELRWVAAMTLQHLFHVYWVAQAAQVQDLNYQHRQGAARVEEKRQRKEKAAAGKSVSLHDMESLLAAADAAAADEPSEDESATRQVFFGCCTVAPLQ